MPQLVDRRAQRGHRIQHQIEDVPHRADQHTDFTHQLTAGVQQLAARIGDTQERLAARIPVGGGVLRQLLRIALVSREQHVAAQIRGLHEETLRIVGGIRIGRVERLVARDVAAIGILDGHALACHLIDTRNRLFPRRSRHRIGTPPAGAEQQGHAQSQLSHETPNDAIHPWNKGDCVATTRTDPQIRATPAPARSWFPLGRLQRHAPRTAAITLILGACHRSLTSLKLRTRHR